MTQINTAANPYYDDFSAAKGFHKILFKPKYAVQARELTQLQTILQEQIKRFGDHVFKNGSVVIPGNSTVDVESVFLKIQPSFAGNALALATFDQVEISNEYGVRARITKTIPAENSDPITFFVKYVRGSDDGNRVRFERNQVLTVVNSTTGIPYATDSYKCQIEDSDTFTGLGSIAHLNTGVFYINGKFVYTEKQSVVIGKYTDRPHCKVLLRLEESIVTAEDDQTLLDPAYGSTNYSAPGADRYYAGLVLEAHPYDFVYNDDYIELMRLNNGTLEEHQRNSRYNELEKNIARRTYDESGDYTVHGFKVAVTDHLKSDATPSGQWSALQGGDADLLSVRISPGKAYVKGFEVDRVSDSFMSVPRARDEAHTKQINDIATTIQYGQYVLITGVEGLPDFTNYEEVEFYSSSDIGVGDLLGSARVIGIKLHSGDAETSRAVYALYLFDKQIQNSDLGVGGVVWVGGGAKIVSEVVLSNATGNFQNDEVISVGTDASALVHSWNAGTSTLQMVKATTGAGLTEPMPSVGQTVVGGTSSVTAQIRSSVTSGIGYSASIIPLPTKNVNSLYYVGSEISYEVFKFLTVTSTNSSTVTTISSGTLSPKTSENTVAMTAAGVIAPSKITFSGGNTITINTTGITNGSQLMLVVPVTVTNPTKKTKTKTTTTNTFVAPGSQTLTLNKADLIRIISVTDTTSSTDITSQCAIVDRGFRDSYYGPGVITIPSGSTGHTVQVLFEYFAHSAGDFFCVDSYPSRDDATIFTSADGTSYDLADCLDFRPTLNTSSNTLINFPRDNSQMFVDLKYYVGRVDQVFIESNGVIRVVSGVPSDTPKAQAGALASAMLIATMSVPPYTKRAADVIVRNVNNRRYTMRDIGEIVERVERVEYFSALSEAEKSVIDMTITDPSTGLSRFKSGYLIDSFDNNTTGDFLRDGFSTAYKQSFLTPKVEREEVLLNYNESASTNVAFVGGKFMLPYSETAIIQQPFASKVNNLNPFLMVSWNGTMKLEPSQDLWSETVDGPTIRQAITFNDTVTVPSSTVTSSPNSIVVPAPSPVVSTPTPVASSTVFNDTSSTVISVSTNAENSPVVEVVSVRLAPGATFTSLPVMRAVLNTAAGSFLSVSILNVNPAGLPAWMTLSSPTNTLTISGVVPTSFGDSATPAIIEFDVPVRIVWGFGLRSVNRTVRVAIQVTPRSELSAAFGALRSVYMRITPRVGSLFSMISRSAVAVQMELFDSAGVALKSPKLSVTNATGALNRSLTVNEIAQIRAEANKQLAAAGSVTRINSINAATREVSFTQDPTTPTSVRSTSWAGSIAALTR